MGVYERFIWDPYVMSFEETYFRTPKEPRILRRAIKELFRSARMIRFKSRLVKKNSLQAPPLPFRTFRIPQRSLSAFRHMIHRVEWTKQKAELQEEAWRIAVQEQFLQRKLRHDRKMVMYSSEAMKRFRDMMMKIEKARFKEEQTREEKRFYDQILRDYYVQPTKEAFEVLPFRVRTYPWKVLSIHEKTIVVEQVSKTGTKYRVTYHKSFMEKTCAPSIPCAWSRERP